MKLLNYLRQPSRRVAWTMSIEVCAVCSGNVNTLTGKNPHRFMGNSRMRFIRTLELYRSLTYIHTMTHESASSLEMKFLILVQELNKNVHEIKLEREFNLHQNARQNVVTFLPEFVF